MIGVEPRNPAALRGIVERFEGRAGEAWPSWAFSNHDVTRAVSKWSKKFQTDPRLAKMLPALVTSMRGTAFIYQGEELGLPETKMEYGDLQDPWAKFLWPKSQGAGRMPHADAVDVRQPVSGFFRWNGQALAAYQPCL